MARHRNIRGMDLDEEYEGYYSCYGHSVEEDSCISPHTGAQFLYNRRGNRQTMSAFMDLQSPVEDEYNSEDSLHVSQNSQNEVCADGSQKNVNPIEIAMLQSCVEAIQNVVGDTIPESLLIEAAKNNNFDYEKALDAVLNKSNKESKDNATSFSIMNSADVSLSDYENKNDNQRICTDMISKDIMELTISSKVDTQSQNSQIDESIVQSDVFPQAAKNTADNVLQVYKKERDTEKPLLNLVVIGHVDAGKSTLMGHLLFSLGCVPKKTMHKYEQDSKKLGKASFMYAWVLDETSEERNRGITMDVAQSKFETPNKSVNLLDAPGHKDFIPNMITGASQADVAILVVDATKGEFETGFEAGGQTREHTMLIRSLGVSQLAVAVNKMDNVMWNKERYNEIVSKLASFLKLAGFKESDISFVPCSGLTGENLTKPPETSQLKKWYIGQTLIQVIDAFKPPERPIMKALRISVNDVFKGMGSGICVSGRIETGMIQNSTKVLVMPSGELAVVKGVTIDGSASQHAFAGDSVVLQLIGIDINNITSGNILCDINNPVKVSDHFEARLVVFSITRPITKGFSVVLHYQSLSEQAIIKKLVSQLHRTTGEVVRKHPRCLNKYMSAIVEIKVSKAICLELHKDFKVLGRFMLRSGGSTIAAGIVTNVPDFPGSIVED